MRISQRLEIITKKLDELIATLQHERAGGLPARFSQVYRYTVSGGTAPSFLVQAPVPITAVRIVWDPAPLVSTLEDENGLVLFRFLSSDPVSRTVIIPPQTAIAYRIAAAPADTVVYLTVSTEPLDSGS